MSRNESYSRETNIKRRIVKGVAAGVTAVTAAFGVSACGGNGSIKPVQAQEKVNPTQPGNIDSQLKREGFNFATDLCYAPQDHSTTKKNLEGFMAQVLQLSANTEPACTHDTKTIPGLIGLNSKTAITRWMTVAGLVSGDMDPADQGIIQVTDITKNTAAENAKYDPYVQVEKSAPRTEPYPGIHCALDATANQYTELCKFGNTAYVTLSLPQAYTEPNATTANSLPLPQQLTNIEQLSASMAGLAISVSSGY